MYQESLYLVIVNNDQFDNHDIDEVSDTGIFVHRSYLKWKACKEQTGKRCSTIFVKTYIDDFKLELTARAWG